MVWVFMVISAVLFLTVIVLCVRLFFYKKNIVKMTENVNIINASKTNNLVTTKSNDKTFLSLVNAVNVNIRKCNEFEYKIAREENKLVSTITNLSHDLRTPVTSILGYTQMLSKGKLDEAQSRYVNVISARIKTLKELIDELYEYSLAYEEHEVNLQRVDIRKLIEETVLSYYEDFVRNNFDVRIDMGETPIYYDVDLFDIRRVLINLIGNAIKYGHTVFKIEYTDGAFLFRNRVTGMDAIDVYHIWDRFFTVARSRTNGSTGLGLSISKKLVENMGGTMEAVLEEDMLSIILRIKK